MSHLCKLSLFSTRVLSLKITSKSLRSVSSSIFYGHPPLFHLLHTENSSLSLQATETLTTLLQDSAQAKVRLCFLFTWPWLDETRSVTESECRTDRVPFAPPVWNTWVRTVTSLSLLVLETISERCLGCLACFLLASRLGSLLFQLFFSHSAVKSLNLL